MKKLMSTLTKTKNGNKQISLYKSNLITINTKLTIKKSYLLLIS